MSPNPSLTINSLTPAKPYKYPLYPIHPIKPVGSRQEKQWCRRPTTADCQLLYNSELKFSPTCDMLSSRWFYSGICEHFAADFLISHPVCPSRVDASLERRNLH
jgi:hypothetical protein